MPPAILRVYLCKEDYSHVPEFEDSENDAALQLFFERHKGHDLMSFEPQDRVENLLPAAVMRSFHLAAGSYEMNVVLNGVVKWRASGPLKETDDVRLAIIPLARVA